MNPIQADANAVIAKLTKTIGELTLDKAVREAALDAAEQQISDLMEQIRASFTPSEVGNE